MELVQITETFADAGGALENVLVTAELVSGASRMGMTSSGQVKYSARTDADGELLLDIVPNTQGLTNTYYVFNAWHPTTGNKLLDNAAGVVPGYSVTLSDVLSRNPNPISRAIAKAEETKSNNDYMVALDLVADQPAGYTKRSYEARLAVVNLQLWPHTQRKLDWASTAVGLLSSGTLKSELTKTITVFSPFVTAYVLASVAAHSHKSVDVSAAQAALNAASYDSGYRSVRDNIQSLLESVFVYSRFSSTPVVSDPDYLSSIVAGAHPMISLDGLSVRNPGAGTFAFLSDKTVQPGSGWHCVEFELSDDAIGGLIGISDRIVGVLDDPPPAGFYSLTVGELIAND